MTEGTGEITLAQLAKKIDEQARFTRSISIICCLSILGVMFYMVTEMFSNLPGVIILQYMANLEKIVYEWKIIENNIAYKKAHGMLGKGIGGPDTTTAAPAATTTTTTKTTTESK
ncbi:MAG TPA: hypothetical protein V6C72_15575 [Chroococcales cyanobacterium]